MKGGSSNTSGLETQLKKTKLPLLLPKDIQNCRTASQGEQTPFVVCDWMPNI